MNSIEANQNDSVLRSDKDFFITDKQDSGSKQSPFASYLQQSLWGINESYMGVARGYQELAIGKGPGLQNVATADFETHFLLYLAAGIASQTTKAATTFMQMQF